MRSETVIVEVFFLLLFLLLAGVDMWITQDISVAWPCGRIEQEAVVVRAWDRLCAQVRHRDIPRLLFACYTVKTEHYPGHYSE